jgi:hypothetical protein
MNGINENIFKNQIRKLNTEMLSKNKSSKKLDSVIVTFLDPPSVKITYEYNGQNKISQSVFYFCVGSEYYPFLKNYFSYDDNKNSVQFTEYISTDGYNWGLDFSEITYYTKNGEKEKILSRKWSGTQWENNRLTESFFDISGRDTLTISSDWNGSAWIPYYRKKSEYSLNGKGKNVSSENDYGTGWEKFQLQSYKNDENGRTSEILTQKWDGTLWTNNAKAIFIYEGFKESIYLQTWGGAKFFDFGRFTTLTDKDGYFIESFYDKNENDSWLPAESIISLYNPDGYEVHYIANSMKAYYRQPDKVKTEDALTVKDMELFQNFPNPFNPSTVIKYNVNKAGNITLKIFDVMGREVKNLVNEYKQAGSYSVEFNASNLPSGVYFAKITSGKSSLVNKMLLLK